MPKPPPQFSHWQLLKTTLAQWSADRGPRLAAAFAYYAIFSIGPLLIVALALVGLIFGPKAANDQLRPQLASYLGDKTAQFVQTLVSQLGASTHLSLTGILSLLLILYAATNLFISLQDSLNSIFGVEPKPNRGLKGILADRTLSILMVLLAGAFVLASIVLSIFLASASSWLHAPPLLLQSLNFLLSALIFTLLFALMFKMLPDIQINWKDTLIGAAATSILFTVARIALGYYLTRPSIASPYGAAGSLVVIMLFIYYSSQIFFLGAKFTQVYACREGTPIRPSKNALPLQSRQPANRHSDTPSQPCDNLPPPNPLPAPRTQFRLQRPDPTPFPRNPSRRYPLRPSSEKPNA